MPQRPIKVMHIIARLNIGGSALQVILLAEYFKLPTYESILVCGHIDASEGDMQYLADEKGIVPIVIPQLGRGISLLRDWRTVWALYRLIRKHRPDIIHTHTAKAGFVGRIAAWLARVPVRIHTFHGHVFHGYFSKRKTQFFLLLERFCARISTRIIAISPIMRDELANTYKIAPYDKFAVVPYGFELQQLANSDTPSTFRQDYQLPHDKKLVAIVGRIVPIKNHELFLRAAAVVIAKRQDLHFVIVGDGELRSETEQLIAELGIGDFISFTGWIKDIASVLHAIDIMALTSNNEGTPVSLIEAMAAGIPIVATAVGGVPDVLGHGQFGVLVPSGNIEKFAEALAQVADGQHPDTRLTQTFALQHYGVSRLVQEMDQLHRQLLAENGVSL